VADQGGGRGAKKSFGVEGVTWSLRHELGLSMQAVSLVYDRVMVLRPLATRVPREVEREIRDVMDFLGVEKSQAVRMILEIGISEWRKRTALDLLREGKVTMAKAAKLAKLDIWDFVDLVRDRRIEWVTFPVGELQEDAKKAAKASGE